MHGLTTGFLGMGALALSACGGSDATAPVDIEDGDGGFGSGTIGGAGAPGYVGAGAVTGTGAAVGTGGAHGPGGALGAGATGGTTGVVGAGAAGATGGEVGGGGAVGTGGTAAYGAAGSGVIGAGGTVDPSHVSSCLASATEGVMFGDSYVSYFGSPDLQPALAGLFPFAGGYRNYSVAGTSLASGGLTGFIPPQLVQAIKGGPFEFAITDGGGNDILLCDGLRFPGCSTLCSSPGSSSQQVCRDIVELAISTAESFMDDMAAAGVEDLIYFFYPHVPASNGGYVEILDYAEPIARALCEGAVDRTEGALRCHFVSLTQPFADAGGDMNPANFVGDGIHPSQLGNDIMAREIYAVMQSECIGMDSSAPCCSL